jgi:membrane protein DedA with SNARE-associated domain
LLVDFAVNFILSVISALGYPGIVFLMALESMIAPVPSEIVMPFAGFLAAQGNFDLVLLAVFATVGTIIGSFISYWIGRILGREIVLKYGKYLLLERKQLDWTEKFFAKHGEKTIFLSRFVPVVRHLISIPAGLAEMNQKKFVAYTAAGGFVWNAFLAWVGFSLKEQWKLVYEYSSELDLIAIAAILVLFIWFVWSHWKRKK